MIELPISRRLSESSCRAFRFSSDTLPSKRSKSFAETAVASSLESSFTRMMTIQMRPIATNARMRYKTIVFRI